jgi:hypothetical protein
VIDVLEFVGVDDPVLDWVVVDVSVLDEVWVLDVVVLAVWVLDDVTEFVVKGLEEEVLVVTDVFVDTGDGLIVREGNSVIVGWRVALAENVEVVVFVEVFEAVPVDVGIIPFITSCLSML